MSDPVTKGAETRQRLMRAGFALIATRGYHRTRVSDIVRCVGVTQGTFYWHFDSKLALALEIIREGREQMLLVLKQGFREEPVGVDDMVQNSIDLFTRLFEFALENREFIAFYLAGTHGSDPDIDTEISETRHRIREALQENIEQAMHLGMLPDSPASASQARVLYSLITGTLSWWLLDDTDFLERKPELAASELARQVVEFEFFGLLGRQRRVPESVDAHGNAEED